MTILPSIIGQPPTGTDSSDLTYNSLPVMEIVPEKPNFETSSTLFTLTPDWNSYNTILKYHKFTLANTPLKLAYIADNFPTDSFTNQYAESFLNRFTDLVSTGSAELSQISGERDAGKAVRKMLDSMAGSNIGMIKAFGEGAIGAMNAASAGFQSITSGLGKTGKAISNVTDVTKKLLGGARVDMPMIWKNSGFTPSYSITVRLYNPQPSNYSMKEKYIIGPIASILTLALPQTEDGTYYNWPFFCTIKVPGLLHIPSAYIGNVTLVKGGDQQQIAYTQELGVVDVRIEFGSLYDTMVVGTSYNSNNRPTLENYLNNMRDKRNVYYRDEINGGSLSDQTTVPQEDTTGRINQGTVDVSSEPADRVSTSDSNDASLLLNDQPNLSA